MSYKIILTNYFKHEAKQLIHKYASLKEDHDRVKLMRDALVEA